MRWVRAIKQPDTQPIRRDGRAGRPRRARHVYRQEARGKERSVHDRTAISLITALHRRWKDRPKNHSDTFT